MEADKNELYGLWMHENLRVFQDRMVSNRGPRWFRALVDRVRAKKLGVTWDRLWAAMANGVIYARLSDPRRGLASVPARADMKDLQRVVEEALERL